MEAGEAEAIGVEAEAVDEIAASTSLLPTGEETIAMACVHKWLRQTGNFKSAYSKHFCASPKISLSSNWP